MTDLINNNVNRVNELIHKFNPIVNDLKNKNNVPIICIIFDVAMSHIKEKYATLDDDTKTWGIILMKELFDRKVPINVHKLPSEQGIRDILNGFYEYRKTQYDTYVKTLPKSTSKYMCDRKFLELYLKEKGGL
jgi:hypothetical protein